MRKILWVSHFWSDIFCRGNVLWLRECVQLGKDIGTEISLRNSCLFPSSVGDSLIQEIENAKGFYCDLGLRVSIVWAYFVLTSEILTQDTVRSRKSRTFKWRYIKSVTNSCSQWISEGRGMVKSNATVTRDPAHKSAGKTIWRSNGQGQCINVL